MPAETTSVAASLATAIVNDHRYGPSGIVSRNDARKMLKVALNAIEESVNPMDVFAYNARYFDAAKVMVGKSVEAPKILDSYSTKGQITVNRRLAELGKDLQLPSLARAAFARYVKRYIDYQIAPEDLVFSNETKLPDGGFRFDWCGGEMGGQGFVVKFDGEWIPSPIVFDPEILPDVLAEARAHFDNNVTAWASDYHSDEELTEYRAQIAIGALKVNQKPDNYDKTDEGFEPGFPFEFCIEGGTPGDGTLYVAFNPESGELNGFGRWA